MRKLILALALLATGWGSQAADLQNGERINRACALCHGQYAQGTPGRLSPRLAGMPQEYLAKAVKEYQSGARVSPTMVVTSGLDEMSDSDIEDVAAYLAQLELPAEAMFNVRQVTGDAPSGQEYYLDECKTCHRRDGSGKPEKNIPPLAGQHSAYVFQTIKMFQGRVRVHDDDPEDDSFDDLGDDELVNITAFLATLDDERYAAAQAEPTRVAMSTPAPAPQKKIEPKQEKAATGGLQITDISQTVAQMKLRDGVSIEDAIDAMMSKAIELNMKLVAQQYVSKELEARGEKTPYLSIFQFCNPMDARSMVMYNPIFASYMPCRIALVEDQEGQHWLMMLNLDMLVNSNLLPPEVVEIAIRVNQGMLDIMVAGATGEF